MRRVLELIAKVAPSDANVLISGESGTGKELVAHALHYASPRADGPFVTVNCGAVSRERLEPELFGQAADEGLIREADGGTLFLDEISELAPALQAKLLDAMQNKTVRPVGGRQSFPVDVRFLAAMTRGETTTLASLGEALDVQRIVETILQAEVA